MKTPTRTIITGGYTVTMEYDFTTKRWYVVKKKAVN